MQHDNGITALRVLSIDGEAISVVWELSDYHYDEDNYWSLAQAQLIGNEVDCSGVLISSKNNVLYKFRYSESKIQNG